MDTNARVLDKEENTLILSQENERKVLDLSPLFPCADFYLLHQLENSFIFANEEAARKKADELKEFFDCANVKADDILISVMLFIQSPEAALRKIEVLKSAEACLRACAALSLDASFTQTLLNAYASLGSARLFSEEYKEISGAPLPETFEEKQTSPVINAMLDGLKQNEVKNRRVREDNRAFAEELLSSKKISSLVCEDFLSAYGADGARALRTDFEEIFDMLSSMSENEKLNYTLTSRAVLFQITKEEAQSTAEIASKLRYPILADDLQKIAFKYFPNQSAEEIVSTFEMILKRLSFVRSPLENLGYAVKVMTEGSDEVFREAQKKSALRKDKILYMRALGAVKNFSGYEDELTSLYHGALSAAEVKAKFNEILNALPCKDYKEENGDIALKVLLNRLTMKEASSQARFRCESSAQKYLGSPLENEALRSYLGTKDKEEVLSIIRASLKSFDFWNDDEAKYCYALTLIMGELNGRISPLWRDIGLTLLQRGAAENSIEYIIQNLSSQSDIDYQALLNGYERFYSITKDHQDTAMRVVNMLQ